MTKWQPIETAPVGTRLLFWWRLIGDNNPYAEAVVTGSLPYPPTGQWWNGQAGIHQDIWHLTHWMPLPEPPKRPKAGFQQPLKSTDTMKELRMPGWSSWPEVRFNGRAQTDGIVWWWEEPMPDGSIKRHPLIPSPPLPSSP